jgi:patatin-like phospholipase/acyl hydrolase
MHLAGRIRRPGPKKILTLDGGGIRGLITIGVLQQIEELLRLELGRGRDFVLAEYFDFIAGTSTGAVIAAAIALGMPMDTIRRFYLDSGTAVFNRASLCKRFRYKYEHKKFAAKLQSALGVDTTLGSHRLSTLLMLVLRNATTDSPWLVTNNPFAKYNQRLQADGTPCVDCNLDMPLWQLVRASAAAPTYFPPEVVRVGTRDFVFVDGGVTPYNNPAFIAFLVATMEAYQIGWAAGEDLLLLVSVGTGSSAQANEHLEPRAMHLFYHAAAVPEALIYGAQNQQDMLCRVFGPVSPRLFTYVRYDVETSRQGLDALGLWDVQPSRIQRMDTLDSLDELQRVGHAVGTAKVRPEHYAGFLQCGV